MPPNQNMVRVRQQQLNQGSHNEQSYPYYSRVRFAFANSVASGVNTITLAAGTELKAFNYAQGQSLTGAGFGGSLTATALETNLIKQSETVAGEAVNIFGVSFLLDADADAELTRLVFANTSVRIGLNGDQQLYQLGPLSMLPGGGGLHGIGRSDVVESPALDRYAMVGSLSNGLPGRSNYYQLPTPILWLPPGGADATLVITARIERAISMVSTNRTASAPASGSTGTVAFTAPTTSSANTYGTYTGGWFVLHSITKAPRSVNA
jgi:hypothetical protein